MLTYFKERGLAPFFLLIQTLEQQLCRSFAVELIAFWKRVQPNKRGDLTPKYQNLVFL